jgi:carbonic anhydrase
MSKATKWCAWPLAAMVMAISIAALKALAAPGAPSVDGAQALQRLLDGNQRYAAGQVGRPNQSTQRRTEVAGGQHPFAAVLGCSDSRVPPELVFDAGLGDLFVVRLAGNVADPVAIESLDYSVKHLGVRLILILGHEKCGAITAAVAGHEEPGDVGPMLAELRPAVAATKAMAGDPVANAARANVELTVAKLANSKPLRAMVESGELKIVGGIYHLASGKVEMLPESSPPH